MSNEKKLTKAQKFAMLREIPDVAKNEVLVEFIDHELELLAKKNSADKKPTAKQTENEGIKTAIVEALADEPTRLFTITDMQKNIPACEGLANQRISAIIRPLIGNSIERVEDKRKVYFRYLAD